MIRRFLAAATVVACTAPVLLWSPAAYGAAAVRLPTLGPEGAVDCSQGEVLEGGVTDFGFVVITKADGRVNATVVVRNGEPDTTYVVRLAQNDPGGADCFTVDGTVTTNAAGQGSGHFSEPVIPEATLAVVIIDTSSLQQRPSYVTPAYTF